MHLNYGRILALFLKANVVEILGRFLAFGGNTSTTNQQGKPLFYPLLYFLTIMPKKYTK